MKITFKAGVVINTTTIDATKSFLDFLKGSLGQEISQETKNTTSWGETPCCFCDGGVGTSYYWEEAKLITDPCVGLSVVSFEKDVVGESWDDIILSAAGVKITRLDQDMPFLCGERIYPQYNEPTEEQTVQFKKETENMSFERKFSIIHKWNNFRSLFDYEGYVLITVSDQKHAAHFIHSASRGCNGGETHMRNLCKWIQKMGLKVDIKYLPKTIA